MPDKVKVSQGGFSTILGLSTTKNSDPEKRPGDTSFLGRYTQAELKSYLNNIYVPPQNAVQTMTAAGISSFVRPIHQKIGTEIIDAKRMAPIAPEIDQCKMIMSSAIISPNDLQNGEFIFSFNNVPALVNDKELGLAIAELYSKFFNDTLKFNISEILDPTILFDDEDSASLIAKVRLTVEVNDKELRVISDSVVSFVKIETKWYISNWDN